MAEIPIPWWLNPEELGERTADWWLENPSAQDPTKTNGKVLIGEVIADIQERRPLSQRFWSPIKEAARRGFVSGATKSEYSPEEAEVVLRTIDPNAIDLTAADE